ncbi:MAG: hypothetical protein ABH891_03895 [Candidatus Omnitrophota bacterium]
MDDENKETGFVEKEKVRVIPTRKGEELHFAVVEVDGEIRGDIRFFVKIKERKGMLAARRGIAVLPAHFKAFQEGVTELAAKLESYGKKA